ncbi:DUF5820 family protein [Saliphagus infecundisoli]|uniref:DUF5820 family protein n=1 Tax=Saliphagus infecundisoli TaxID=1849069 RepID=A0ABD5QDY7_9EURY|nr:DUF5820 family protein [Saliphagus infecundisoli]
MTDHTDLADLPPGWTVWSEEDERTVIVYRADVFDAEAFPAACLPTLYLTRGRRDRRPGVAPTSPGADWHVTLTLEPEVTGEEGRFERREEALAYAVGVARRFADGGIDYRGLYQVPREEYFAKLDELTGREP